MLFTTGVSQFNINSLIKHLTREGSPLLFPDMQALVKGLRLEPAKEIATVPLSGSIKAPLLMRLLGREHTSLLPGAEGHHSTQPREESCSVPL